MQSPCAAKLPSRCRMPRSRPPSARHARACHSTKVHRLLRRSLHRIGKNDDSRAQVDIHSPSGCIPETSLCAILEAQWLLAVQLPARSARQSHVREWRQSLKSIGTVCSIRWNRRRGTIETGGKRARLAVNPAVIKTMVAETESAHGWINTSIFQSLRKISSAPVHN